MKFNYYKLYIRNGKIVSKFSHNNYEIKQSKRAPKY